MEIASHADEVLIWRQGATVTRRIALPQGTPQGATTLCLPGLPLTLRDASVRLSVSGNEQTDVRVTSARVTLHAAARAELPPEPDTLALKEARRKLVHVQHTLALIEAERVLLQQIEVPERPDGEEGKPPPPSPMAARVALDSFVDEGTAARDAEIAALIRERTRLFEEVAAIEDAVRRRDAAMRARPDEVTKAVVALLDVRNADGAEILLRYTVPGARWVPVYQIHVSGDGTRATLAMRAAIAQATGENWRGVKLVLSTALPEAYTELPRLKSLRIGKAQPPPPSPLSFRAPPAGADRLFFDFDRECASLGHLAPPRRARRSAPSIPTLPGLFSDIERPAAVAADSPVEILAEPAGAFAFDEDDDSEMQEETEEREMLLAAPAKRRTSAVEMRKKAVKERAPAPKAAAPRRRGRADEKPDLEEEQDEGIALDAEPDAPVAARLPLFASLSLPAPTDPARSRLALQSTTEVWLSGLSRAAGFDVLGHIGACLSEAEAVQRLATPDGTAPVERSTGRFDYSYRADAPVDLPSDGGWHTVPLVAREGGCALRYVVVPREDPAVFRVATLDNPLAAPLLAGPVEVYVGGMFQLTSQLPTVAPGESVELGMGVEPAIRAARNTSFEERRSGERVVAMTELHHTLNIELRNTLTRKVDIEVRERIPQPGKDAEVAVDEERVEPAWEAYTQRERQAPLKGGRRWRVVLKARETISLSAHYVVRIYANNELIGGNRREV